MRKLGNWLIKVANVIASWWNGLKCKWNKALLFISFSMNNCENKICTCKK